MPVGLLGEQRLIFNEHDLELLEFNQGDIRLNEIYDFISVIICIYSYLCLRMVRAKLSSTVFQGLGNVAPEAGLTWQLSGCWCQLQPGLQCQAPFPWQVTFSAGGTRAKGGTNPEDSRHVNLGRFVWYILVSMCAS